jgi:hypothetical protein
MTGAPGVATHAESEAEVDCAPGFDNADAADAAEPLNPESSAPAPRTEQTKPVLANDAAPHRRDAPTRSANHMTISSFLLDECGCIRCLVQAEGNSDQSAGVVLPHFGEFAWAEMPNCALWGFR